MRTGRNAREALAAARAKGIYAGYPLGRDYPGLDDALLVAVTEKRTVEEIDRLVEALVVKLIYEKSQAGPPRDRRAEARPARARGARRARAQEPAAPARARRAGGAAPLHRALDAQLRHRHRLLPARQLHDEVQPAHQRAARRAAGLREPASARRGRRGAGRARARVGAAGDPARGDRASTPSRCSRPRAARAS